MFRSARAGPLVGPRAALPFVRVRADTPELERVRGQKQNLGGEGGGKNGQTTAASEAAGATGASSPSLSRSEKP